MAFILGGHSFRTEATGGTVQGQNFLGFEFNAWSSLLTLAAGLLLVFGAPLHWGAKTMSLIVGLALGAASVIALDDKSDVFGIFAANGPTKLLWGAAGSALIILSLLPRVGGKQTDADDEPDRRPRREPELVTTRRPAESERVVERPVAEPQRVASPAQGVEPEPANGSGAVSAKPRSR